MAYPTIADFAYGRRNTDGASAISIIIPANTQSGDTVVLFFNCTGTDYPTTPDGWTLLIQGNSHASGSNFSIFYKKLVGSLSSFDVSFTLNCRVNYYIFRIASDCYFSTSDVITGNSKYPNSPSLSSPFINGTEVLWLSYAHWDGLFTISDYPTSFSENRFTYTNTNSSGSGMAVSSKSSQNASEEPEAYSLIESDTDWAGVTVAVAIDPEYASTGTKLKKYNGATWDEYPLKYYDGADFVEAKLKKYNGATWDEV